MHNRFIVHLQGERGKREVPERGGGRFFLLHVAFLKRLLSNKQLLAFARGEGMGNRAHQKIYK
jgi:hypothetical protein